MKLNSPFVENYFLFLTLLYSSFAPVVDKFYLYFLLSFHLGPCCTRGVKHRRENITIDVM